MHYKNIKCNIKIPLNIHNFHFCGALRAKSSILRICARSAPNFFGIFQISPPPHPKNGSTPLFSPPPPPPHFKKASYALVLTSVPGGGRQIDKWAGGPRFVTIETTKL